MTAKRNAAHSGKGKRRSLKRDDTGNAAPVASKNLSRAEEMRKWINRT